MAELNFDNLLDIFELANPTFMHMRELMKNGYSVKEIAAIYHIDNADILREDDKEDKDDRTLEQKYWDCQRLIDRYQRESDLDKRNIKFWQNRYYEAVKKYHSRDDDNLEVIRLRNQLTLERIKAKERERYLEAYQKLYVEECLKNRKKQKKEDTETDNFLSLLKDYLSKD